MMLLQWVFVIFFCLGAQAEVKFSTQVDKALITTRDELRFAMKVEADSLINFQFPDVSSHLDGMRIVDFGEKETNETGHFQKEKYFVLRADLAGSYILPALTLNLVNPDGSKQELKSAEIFVEVESASKKEEKEGKTVTDIRGLKDLVREKHHRLYYLLVALVALVGMAGGLVWWQRYRKKRPPVIPPIAPHLYAYQQLTRLENNMPTDLASMKLFAYQLSEIFRWYVEQIFHFHVTDLTTEEIRSLYQEKLTCTDELKEDFFHLLVKLDWVKFTDSPVSVEECGQFLGIVKKFIQATAPADSILGQKEKEQEQDGEDFL